MSTALHAAAQCRHPGHISIGNSSRHVKQSAGTALIRCRLLIDTGIRAGRRHVCCRSGPSQPAAAATSGNGAAAQADRQRVAVLGIGLMGNKIARRLAQQGHSVAAWNRTPAKAEQLADAGISVVLSPTDALQQSDVVLLVLADAASIWQTLLEDAGGKEHLAGKTIVQMGTIGPNESRELAKQMEAAGAEYIEAPVLGSQPEASKGTLLIMVGSGADPRHSAAWPVLCDLGRDPKRLGAVGTAAATKLALNQLIASLTVGFSTSLGLLQRNGADIDAFMGILRDSALYAPTFDKKLGKMLDRDFEGANFPLVHLLKDVRLFSKEAAEAGLDSRVLDALDGVIASTVAQDRGQQDYSAVYEGVTNPACSIWSGDEGGQGEEQRSICASLWCYASFRCGAAAGHAAGRQCVQCC